MADERKGQGETASEDDQLRTFASNNKISLTEARAFVGQFYYNARVKPQVRRQDEAK